MSLGWVGPDEPLPTPEELDVMAVLTIDLHADGLRMCCRAAGCTHLAWARRRLADRQVPAS